MFVYESRRSLVFFCFGGLALFFVWLPTKPLIEGGGGGVDT